MTGPTVAARLAALVEGVLGAPLPVRLRAWDGSEAGPLASADAPVVVLRHRRALRRLLWSPGELGLARAFVAGELDVEGDIADGLSRFWRLVRERGSAARPCRGARSAARRPGGRRGGARPPPPPPCPSAPAAPGRR